MSEASSRLLTLEPSFCSRRKSATRVRSRTFRCCGTWRVTRPPEVSTPIPRKLRPEREGPSRFEGFSRRPRWAKAWPTAFMAARHFRYEGAVSMMSSMYTASLQQIPSWLTEYTVGKAGL